MADLGTEPDVPSGDHGDALPAYPAYLDRIASLPGDGRHRRYRHLELQPGHIVLDAGCGLGEVSRALAERVAPNGRAVGVDLNAEHLAIARERAAGLDGVEYQLADVTALPFDDATFDAVYSERVFQHLRRPDAAMCELFRVLRPSGRLVVADADHAATVIDADDRELAERVCAVIAGLGSVNPAAGRRLRSQMVDAGFSHVEVVPEPLVITDYASWKIIEPQQIEDVLHTLLGDGETTRERADSHLADLARRREQGRFLAVLPGYTVIGAKPTSPTD